MQSLNIWGKLAPLSPFLLDVHKPRERENFSSLFYVWLQADYLVWETHSRQLSLCSAFFSHRSTGLDAWLGEASPTGCFRDLGSRNMMPAAQREARIRCVHMLWSAGLSAYGGFNLLTWLSCDPAVQHWTGKEQTHPCAIAVCHIIHFLFPILIYSFFFFWIVPRRLLEGIRLI